ncbi:MAG TPA: hypothetical protein VFV03_07840 [Solirubrobacteraceae bacterium]|nr:hypothetical protein [Solirubrobacteraceae bacterium]
MLARNRPLRLTGDELASLSPGEPVIIESIGHTVHLPAFKEVAEQAADTNRSLIIIARGSENE